MSYKHIYLLYYNNPFLLLLSFLCAVGEDAARCAVSGFDLCPSAMFRRGLLPADEWEEAHVDLPRLWQTCPLRAPYYRWVRSKKHVLTYPLLLHQIPFSRFIPGDFMPPVVFSNILELILSCGVVFLVAHRYCVIIMNGAFCFQCLWRPWIILWLLHHWNWFSWSASDVKVRQTNPCCCFFNLLTVTSQAGSLLFNLQWPHSECEKIAFH